MSIQVRRFKPERRGEGDESVFSCKFHDYLQQDCELQGQNIAGQKSK